MLDLGTLGGTYSVAYGINDSGEVVGISSVLPGGTDYHAFLYTGGVMHDLGTLGGNYSQAYAINDSGQVAGAASLPGATHAFLYSGGVMYDLDGTSGNSEGYGINGSGEVVGEFGNGTNHAFLYSNGVMQDLGSLGGNSWAQAVNDSGQVAGWSYLENFGGPHAFLYSNGVMQDLGTLGGLYSYAFGIDAAGQVVGYRGVAGEGGRAFLYSGGLMTDLNSLISTPGWDIGEASAINGRGQIAGSGFNPQYGGGAVLLSPLGAVPEPASFVLLGAGLFGLIVAASFARSDTRPASNNLTFRRIDHV
jgi:probable HAF family extracellular repeat protein